MRIIGTTKDNAILLVDTNEMIYKYINTQLTEVGTIESIIGLDPFKAPVEHSEIKIFGKYIPVGVVLAYQLGLNNLINILRANPRRVPTGQRVNLQDFEYQLVFSDETLIFNKDNKLATMLLSGFNEYHRSIKNYQAHTFDKAGVYLNIIQSTGITVKYLREIDLLDKLFIDPITKTLLESMNEPTTFKGLLFRSSELLLSERHPDLLDMQYMRIKGYERIAGAVYTEMVQSIRAQKSKTGRMNQKIDLHPYAVWQRITADPSNNMVVDINPLQNLKEIEAITFGGVGGRISRSMTKSTREYHENDKGIISESTVDSGDVAINTFSSANPIFNSLLGTVDTYNNSTGNASLLSSSALLSVAATNDDRIWSIHSVMNEKNSL